MKNNRSLTDFLLSTTGLIILALAINFLSWQFKLVSGGLPGYGLVLNYLSGFPVGRFLLIANTIIFILSFLLIGKTAGIKAVYGYFFLSLVLDFSQKFFSLRQFEYDGFLINSLLTTAQALLAALGVALVIACGYSLGNYSSIWLIISRFRKISAPLFFLVMDLILTMITFALFGFSEALLFLINSVVFFFAFKYSLLFLEKGLQLIK